MSPTSSPAEYVADDRDLPWPPSLDIEPEQCWCLTCGAELPCDCAGWSLAPESLNGKRPA